MKLITYQLPGDELESARKVITSEIFNPVNSLDDADSILHRWIDPRAEVITFGDISKEDFCKLPMSTTVIP